MWLADAIPVASRLTHPRPLVAQMLAESKEPVECLHRRWAEACSERRVLIQRRGRGVLQRQFRLPWQASRGPITERPETLTQDALDGKVNVVSGHDCCG